MSAIAVAIQKKDVQFPDSFSSFFQKNTFSLGPRRQIEVGSDNRHRIQCTKCGLKATQGPYCDIHWKQFILNLKRNSA